MFTPAKVQFILKFPDRTYLAINRKYVQYILLFLWIYYVTVSCEGIETFDLARVYSEANAYVSDFSIVQMIGYRFLRNVDFLYYLILYVAIKVSLPLNFVTALIVFVYYMLSINTIKKKLNVQVSDPVLLAFLFATPMIWVVAISRNLTAVVFFYCAIMAYYEKKKVWTVLFMMAAVLTHFSFLMYVAVFIAAMYMRRIRLQTRSVLMILWIVLAISFLAPTITQHLIYRFVTSQGLGYEGYATAASFNFLTFGSVNYADKVPVAFALVGSVHLLFLNKRKLGFDYWMLLILTGLLIIFMNSSWTLINRCMMMMTIFWVRNVGNILDRATVEEKNKLNLTSLIGLLAIVMQLYGNRHIYFAIL